MQSIDCWRPPGSMLACLSKEASLVQPGSGLAADCIATRHCSRFVDRDAANPGPGPPSRLRVSGTGGHSRLCGSRLAAGSIRGSGERRRRGVRANPHGAWRKCRRYQPGRARQAELSPRRQTAGSRIRWRANASSERRAPCRGSAVPPSGADSIHASSRRRRRIAARSPTASRQS